jgi:hypothetical protein
VSPDSPELPPTLARKLRAARAAVQTARNAARLAAHRWARGVLDDRSAHAAGQRAEAAIAKLAELLRIAEIADPDAESVCAECGAELHAERRSRRYCSATCRVRAYRRRKAGISPPQGQGQAVTHGTASGYSHGCRCPECRKANAARSRAYRAAHLEQQQARAVAYRAAHLDHERAQARAYHAVHLDQERAQARAYHAAHLEQERARLRAASAAYRAAHREQVRARDRARGAAERTAHPEKVHAWAAAWRAAHREQERARAAAWRAAHRRKTKTKP